MYSYNFINGEPKWTGKEIIKEAESTIFLGERG